MDKIEKCNPNAIIKKHISVSINKIEREAGRFNGFILPNGYQLSDSFDVLNWIRRYKLLNQSHITLGGSHCNHKEEKTGCCLGHEAESFGAPRNYKITAITCDGHDLFEQIAHGDMRAYPRLSELAGARVGDFITLTSADGKEAIKLVITCDRKAFQGFSYVGVWRVLQRKKHNGKVQYSI